MKLLILLLSLTIAAADVCTDKYPYSKTEVENAIVNNKWDAVPKNFKCRMYCDFEQANQMIDGVLQESVKDFLAPGALYIGVSADKIATCFDKAVKYDDPCDTVFLFYKCYMIDAVPYIAQVHKLKS